MVGTKHDTLTRKIWSLLLLNKLAGRHATEETITIQYDKHIIKEVNNALAAHKKDIEMRPLAKVGVT